MSKLKIIGISGYARSGKDTAADYISKILKLKKISFADPLKHMLSNVFKIPLQYFYNSKKDEVLHCPIIITKEKLGWIEDYCRESHPDKELSHQKYYTDMKIHSIRELMQIVGTDIIRENFYYDFWIDKMRGSIQMLESVIVPDCRFDNERELIKQLGGTNILIDRFYKTDDKHVSEYKPNFKDFVVIKNTSTKEQYFKNIQEFIKITKEESENES